MPQEEIALLREILNDIHNEGGSDEDKLSQLGPLLALCDPELTEDDFWKWCRIAHVDDLERAAIYLNKLHFSGIIKITEQYAPGLTHLDIMSQGAVEGLNDENAAMIKKELEQDAEKFRDMLRLNNN